MKKAIIFDMDGLMIDSETITYEMYLKKLCLLGYNDYNKEDYKLLLGKNKKGVYDVFINRYGTSFPFQEFWDETHIWINESLKEHVPIKKGLIELLDYLKTHNYKILVASSSERKRVKEILMNANIFHYFDTIVCGDEVRLGKPDPQIFLTACHKANVLAEDALVLEDSEAGILAAYRGNIDVICIPDMKYPDKDYEEKTLYIMNSLLEVIDYLG